MRKFILLPALLLTVMVWSQDKILNGSWKIVKAFYGSEKESYNTDNTTIIKIFKGGYWISAFYGNPKNPFEGCGGGTYTTTNGKYIETLDYYSWDSTAVGSTYYFDYRLKDNKYFQEGRINSDKYKNYLVKEEFEKVTAAAALQNASLEGVWKMETAVLVTGNPDSSITALKIYSYPRFAWVHYRPQTKQFVAAGGGTYQFDGKKLIETIGYFTYDSTTIKPGFNYELNVEIGKDTYSQADVNAYKKIWKRLK